MNNMDSPPPNAFRPSSAGVAGCSTTSFQKRGRRDKGSDRRLEENANVEDDAAQHPRLLAERVKRPYVFGRDVQIQMASTMLIMTGGNAVRAVYAPVAQK